MIYKFPITRRFTSIGDCPTYQKFMCVDQIGFLVAYTNKSDLTLKNIRRHLMANTGSSVSLMAKGPREALKKFFTLPGSMVGGEHPESKAIWIKGVIEEYPDCELLHEDEECNLICGEIFPSECYLDGRADALEGCSILKYQYALPSWWEKYPKDRFEILTGKNRYRKDGYFFTVQEIAGYKFARINRDLAKKIGGDLILEELPDRAQIDLFAGILE